MTPSETKGKIEPRARTTANAILLCDAALRFLSDEKG
jgi:hypothetical protein